MTFSSGSLQQQVLACAGEAVSDVEVLAALGELEELKNTIAAAQARLAVRLREERLAQRQHLPSPQRTRGVGAEIGLARRESPHRGGRHLSLGWVLCRELPHTLAAMEAGRCSEWSATLLARSTACLTREDRRRVDEALMADPAATAGWGERRLAAEADALAYRLDPQAAVRRRETAVAERHVSLRPVPGVEGAGMTRLSALLPLEAGVATLAALGRAADQARAAGDPRTRGQVMADALVARVTGLEDSGAGAGPAVPVEVNVVVSDATLLGAEGESADRGADQAGWLDGVPLPADTVRELVGRAHAEGLASLRWLYARPSTGQLVAMDSRRGCSRQAWRGSWTAATGRAARRTATPPSGTTTTCGQSSTAVGRPRPTAKGCARGATTPVRPPSSGHHRSRRRAHRPRWPHRRASASRCSGTRPSSRGRPRGSGRPGPSGHRGRRGWRW